MLCPECKRPTKVVSTRQDTSDLTILRRRWCLNSSCNHRFSTREAVVEGKYESTTARLVRDLEYASRVTEKKTKRDKLIAGVKAMRAQNKTVHHIAETLGISESAVYVYSKK